MYDCLKLNLGSFCHLMMNDGLVRNEPRRAVVPTSSKSSLGGRLLRVLAPTPVLGKSH